MRKSFELSSGPEIKLRDPPDWILDDITLSVMRNPVLVSIAQTSPSFVEFLYCQVPSGRSYDLASLEESLKWSGMDPMARTPLHVRDLRPNHNLRDACAEFLQENGWAIDY